MAFVEIYGLFDPDTWELRYVGKTNKANNRLSRHIGEARTSSRPVHRWINGLFAQGKRPALEILEIVSTDQWEIAEKRWIKFHRKTSDLLNVAEGGAMPAQTAEQRKHAGRASKKAIQAICPKLRNLWQAKAMFARCATNAKKRGDLETYESMREHMHQRAAANPALFGGWASK